MRRKTSETLYLTQTHTNQWMPSLLFLLLMVFFISFRVYFSLSVTSFTLISGLSTWIGPLWVSKFKQDLAPNQLQNCSSPVLKSWDGRPPSKFFKTGELQFCSYKHPILKVVMLILVFLWCVFGVLGQVFFFNKKSKIGGGGVFPRKSWTQHELS